MKITNLYVGTNTSEYLHESDTWFIPALTSLFGLVFAFKWYISVLNLTKNSFFQCDWLGYSIRILSVIKVRTSLYIFCGGKSRSTFDLHSKNLDSGLCSKGIFVSDFNKRLWVMTNCRVPWVLGLLTWFIYASPWMNLKILCGTKWVGKVKLDWVHVINLVLWRSTAFGIWDDIHKASRVFGGFGPICLDFFLSSLPRSLWGSGGAGPDAACRWNFLFKVIAPSDKQAAAADTIVNRGTALCDSVIWIEVLAETDFIVLG